MLRAMSYEETMSELESHGTEQNQKIYRRHGASDPLFGVSFKNLRAMAKRIGKDHALATKLWASGNYDARMLATLTADPATMSSRDLDTWVKSIEDYATTDVFAASVVKHTKHAEKKMLAWKKSKRELTAEAGWQLLSHLALDGVYTAKQLEPFIEEIEARIGKADNRVRHAMNNALIAIGGVNDSLARKAKAAAKRIGKVEVDHGETSCKTPAAGPYIDKIRARAKAKKKAAPAKKKPAKKRRVSTRPARGR